MRKNGTLYYILGDHLGSTSIVTDASGNLVSQTKYKAWGEVRHQSGPSLTEYTYTGQYSYTGSFGLMYYNARWYDPYLKRFAQADSIVPPGVQGLDRYAYVNNSPMNYVDPSGHDPWWCDDAECQSNYNNSMANAPSYGGMGGIDEASDYGLSFSSDSDYIGLENDTQAFIDAVRLEAGRMFDVYCNSQSKVDCGYDTPAQLYAATHGATNIHFTNSSLDKFCQRDGTDILCGSTSQGNINGILAAHELGHVFNEIINANGYLLDDPYHDLANERANNHSFPALDVAIAPGHLNNGGSNGEDYANTHSMWIYDDWVDTPAGEQRKYFMDRNMYTWIDQMLNP